MARKFTIFALFYFVGGLYSEGRFNGGFLRYDFWGLYLVGHIHGGAYFWNFTVALNLLLAFRVNFIPEVNTDCFVEFYTSLQPRQEYLMILCLKWMKSTMTSLKLISRW